MLRSFLGQPMVPYDPKDYYTGFYEAFEYQRSFEVFSKLLSSVLAILSLCLSSFTILAMLSSGNTNKAYRRVIIEHIFLSSVLSAMFPLSGLNVIANYQAIIIDKWWINMPVLAFIVACLILFGYFAVVVCCVVSFLLNFVTSTNIQVNLPILRNFEAQQILRFSVITFSIVTSLLSVLLFYEILNYNMTDIITIAIQFDPRLAKTFAEKNIHTLVVTYGMLYYVRLLALFSTSFVLGSFFIIYYNYIRISQQKSRMSKLVSKQQKLIIRIEILYYFMILLCYAPPGLVLFFSLFLKALPVAWERCFLDIRYAKNQKNQLSMDVLQEYLGQPLVPYDPEDYYSGFYEVYEFQKTRSFDTLLRFISTFLALAGILVSSFTVPVLLASENMHRMYRRVIIEHIVISTFGSLIFPITGLNIIANHRAIIMDPWFHCHLLAFISAALAIFSYMSVVVLCIFSFLFNFVISTNFRFRLPVLKQFDTAKLLRFGSMVYGIVTTGISLVIAYESLNYNTDEIITATITYDPRLEKVFLEKNIHTIVITYGMTIYVTTLALISFSFIPAAIIIMSYNYYRVILKESKYSEQVKKHQKLIIRVELLYYLMIILCYSPPGFLLMFSFFFRSLDKFWEKVPVFLIISVPLQSLPILDCLLHILAIRKYRESANRALRSIFPRFETLQVGILNSSIS